jgi:hypothetical protein
MQLAGFYNRQGDFAQDDRGAAERIKIEPNNPEAHYTVATYYWDKAFRDFRLKTRKRCSTSSAESRRSTRPSPSSDDYMEAIAYKNLLLRLQANLETNPARSRRC